ncbi:DUF6199 family natural product biosynthesis protein [Paenibacillus glycanilyticus]|uniref:DUF6199 family natural product biosynthesis protein n=1 Tax=Paenibacillus glycanilyticus TaxID=126569 RepID=UPI000FD8CB1D
MVYIQFLIILSVGLLMTIKPDVIWTIKESWKSNDATEPSDRYILITRIGGVLLIILSLIIVIAYQFI